jgi:hypothetical protein
MGKSRQNKRKNQDKRNALGFERARASESGNVAEEQAHIVEEPLVATY